MRWEGEWVKGIKHLSVRRKNSLEDELLYKQALAYWARYPEEEYWRITSIRPITAGVELLELEITFLNPGKAAEVRLAEGDQHISIPHEVRQTLRSKLNACNSAALREVRSS